MQINTILGKTGRWVDINGIQLFVNVKNQIVLPSYLTGQNMDEFDISSIKMPEVDSSKMQIISALMVGNTISYKRLQEYLNNLASVIKLGNEFKAEQETFEKFNAFVHSYTPIDKSTRDFLHKYLQNNEALINQLGQLITSTGEVEKPKSDIPTVKKENPMNVKKFGLYRFPFLMQEKLFINDIEQYDEIPQDWNYSGTHYKSWYNIKSIPFLVNGYKDEEYSCVNRVLASQIGKLLGLHCEETLFGYLHNKAVTLTAFTECVNLLENQTFELYELDTLNYIYQSEQKRAFYFLIQHWTAFAKTAQGIKERFPEHFVNAEGSVFLSNHQSAMYLTPQQMPRNLMVPLEINKLNYRAIKDMVARVGQKDLAEITFSSIPEEFIELHDEHAKMMNKPLFSQKKESFSTNWDNLLLSLEEFENMPRL
jgi:hypothetical protein